MKFKYLGTAASEGLPGIFCNCENCQKAWREGGRSIMTRSQSIIDDKILVDYGADTYMHCLQMGKSLNEIGYVLITHSHEDHFSYSEWFNRYYGNAYGLRYEKLKMFAHKTAIERIKRVIAEKWVSLDDVKEKFEFIEVDLYKPFKIEEYTITALPAFHTEGEQSLLYLIEKDGKTIFYGNDTGIFTTDIDEYLSKNKIVIDLLSLDCTKGDYPYKYESHLSMTEGYEIYKRLEKVGAVNEKTIKYFTHFTHNCKMTYPDLCEAAKRFNFEVAYDGLEILL
jgi:phosphoribosyl 1,2-cyclic phosphate phosphodiesterase